MPDFNEFVKNLYTSKNRELTEDKLKYIEETYKGKEEDFVKNFYSTIGEELSEEKFNYIKDTYLKKKEQQVLYGNQPFGGKEEEPLLPLTSSTVSPSASKPPKSTTPSASTGKLPKLEVQVEKPVSTEFVGTRDLAATVESREQRKKFLEQVNAGILETVQKDPELFISQKDMPTMYGEKVIPAGTPNVKNISKAVDLYAEKIKRETGRELSSFDKQSIVQNTLSSLKVKTQTQNAAMLTDLQFQEQKKVPLTAITGIKTKEGEVVKEGMFQENIKNTISQEQQRLEQIAKTPNKEINAEFKGEVDGLTSKVKSNADALNLEMKDYFTAQFEEQKNQVYNQYVQLVQSGQMTSDVANAQMKQELEAIGKQLESDTNAMYAPKFNQLKQETEEQVKDIQTRYNRKVQAQFNIEKEKSQKRIKEEVSKYSSSLPKGYLEDYQATFQKNFDSEMRLEGLRNTTAFANLGNVEKMQTAIMAGWGDVAGTVGGALSYVGVNTGELQNWVAQSNLYNELPVFSEGSVWDNITNTDWWIANGVRSIPFTVATMPFGLLGGAGAGMLVKALGATRRAEIISSVIGGGLIGWEAERFLEQGSAFNDAINEGKSVSEASEIAASVGKYNFATIPLNIAQMLPVFGDSFKFLNSAVIEAGSGYLEETAQGWAQAKAKAESEGKDVSYLDYMTSPQAVEEGIIGAGMSQGFTLFSLNNTPDIDKKINALMTSLGTGGESQANLMLEVMRNNDAIDSKQYEEAKALLKYTLNGINQAQNINVEDNVKAALVNKFVAIEKAKELLTENENDLASQAAKELIAEKENEIKNILKGSEPVYLIKIQGNEVPVVSTKEQVESILSNPDSLPLFEIEIYNDVKTRASVDEAYSKQNKDAIQESSTVENEISSGDTSARTDVGGAEDGGTSSIIDKREPNKEPVIQEGEAKEEVKSDKGEPAQGEIEFGTAFQVQDATAENTVGKEKGLWGNSQVWRERIENAGDILRELSSRGDKPDVRYLMEKVEKLRDWIAKNKNGYTPIDESVKTIEDFDKSNLKWTDAVDSREYLERFHSSVLDRVRKEYEAIPTYTKEQRLALDLVLDLINNDIKGLESKLNEIEKISNQIKTNGSLPIVVDVKLGKEQPTPTEKAEEAPVKEEEVSEAEVKSVAEVSGVNPKNIRDLYNIGRDLFALNRVQALAQAVVMDKMIGAMAKRKGVEKSEIYKTVQFKKSSEKDLPQGVKMQMAAWHGSPYEFDKFTTEKIGTGEGAQAFGWGLYFTDLKDIAKLYAKKLAKIKFENKELEENSIFDKLFVSLDESNEEFYSWFTGRIFNLAKFKEYLDDISSYYQEQLKIKVDEKHPLVIKMMRDYEYSQDKIEQAKKTLRDFDKNKYNSVYDMFIKAGVSEENAKNGTDIIFKGVEQSRRFLYEAMQYQSSRASKLDKVINFVKNELKSNANYYSYLSKNSDKFNLSRSLYKVSLFKGKEQSEYTWLEWDKPVSEENFYKIKEALIAKGYTIKGDSKYGFDLYSKNGLSLGHYNIAEVGKYFYENIGYVLGGDKAASLFLLENGIDGIKYAAESISRGATSKTARGFNYVVFDENAVSIEESIKFQKDAVKARGAMMVNMDGQAVIYALSDPNVSTPLHELAHVFEHYLTDNEKNEIVESAGTKGWTIETSEFFARGFEKYLSDGKAPSKGLQRLFDKFKEWLTEIYNGIINSDIDIELNEKMENIYSQMLGVDIKKKKQGFPKNVLAIAEETGLSPQQIQNTYAKYDGSKSMEEITVEDYKTARAIGDKAKLENVTKAFDALLQEESAKTAASPTAKKKAKKALKEADEKAVKEAAKIMEHIDEIRDKLQESGVIVSTSCKWGK